jgi:lipopolysaccharide transport system ATP-binding protein
MSTVIKIENLSKKYVIGHQRQENYTALRDVIMHKLRGLGQRLLHPLSPNKEETCLEEFWALKDINLDIKQGDRIGIIGRNGAGKSTLLKILSRITEPTTGRITLNGRVASLLEVGTGFHPELTGRENIFLNGAVLGMSRADIKKNFEEIVAFAEVEKFLDTPVKRYSSGMYIRLAFAIAAHLEPEILVVDEVLAVGDTQFQKKCIGKMEDVGREGRTVIFVSHNMASVNVLCTKGIQLRQGEIVSSGTIENVISDYLQDNEYGTRSHYRSVSKLSDDNKAVLDEVIVLDSQQKNHAYMPIDMPFTINIKWHLCTKVPFLRFGVEFINEMGVVVLMSVDTDSTDLHGKPRLPGFYFESIEIPPFLLMPGGYSVKFFAGMPWVERILEVSDAIRIEIIENNSHLSNVSAEKRSGFISTPLAWKVEKIDA